MESEEPLTGAGLTGAVRGALSQAGLSLSDVSYRITDLNGEHYKFKEANFAAGRLMSESRTEVFALWHPIEGIGNVGAAIGPCALAVALDAAREEYAPGATVIVHLGNDGTERAAVVLKYQQG